MRVNWYLSLGRQVPGGYSVSGVPGVRALKLQISACWSSVASKAFSYCPAYSTIGSSITSPYCNIKTWAAKSDKWALYTSLDVITWSHTQLELIVASDKLLYLCQHTILFQSPHYPALNSVLFPFKITSSQCQMPVMQQTHNVHSPPSKI